MKFTIKTHYTGLQLKMLDSLTKVFHDQEPETASDFAELKALKEETVSFQIAYRSNEYLKTKYSKGRPCFRFSQVKIESDIAEHIRLRYVKNVPCEYVTHHGVDDNYLRKAPGLYPDRLDDLRENKITIMPFMWQSIWIDVNVPETVSAGTYPIRILFLDDEVEDQEVIMGEVETEISIIDAVLPELPIRRTEWFYCDCLSDYYHVEVFSEEHWRIIENFIETAAKRNVNMILTPQFTPPLDTAVGKERATIQLVDITVEDDKYYFRFDKLERWIQLLKKHGIRYIEMSHLFSQWGAVAAPKIVGVRNGKEEILFDYRSPATGGEYTRFLNIYLPQLIAKLKEWEVFEYTYFHISDEPNLEQLESYQKAYESVKDVLQGCEMFDALSNYEFYSNGLIRHPVCGTSFIKPFLEADTPGLWCYYCTVQADVLSNVFIGMPSGRTRIYGAQVYKFGIEGVLHWGYNFYNAVDSLYRINPYQVTDAGGAYPAGDAFLVYPRDDGTAEESIRLMLLDEAMNDIRVFSLLEKLTSRENVLRLIDEDLEKPLEFDAFPAYPQDNTYLFKLRNKILNEIEKNM